MVFWNWCRGFLLLGCALLAGCQRSPTTPDSFLDGRITGQIYQNDIVGFEIAAPSGWSIEQGWLLSESDSLALLTIMLESEEDSGFTASINVTARPYAGSDLCSSFYDAIESSYLSDPAFTNILFGARQSVDMGGNQACALELSAVYTDSVSGSRTLRFFQAFTVWNGYLIIVTNTGLASTFDSHSLEYSQALQSVRLY